MFVNIQVGKWLKFIVGIAYIGLFIMISGTLFRYFSEFLKTIYFKETPIVIIMLVFLVGTVIANLIGFKAIFHAALAIVPIVLISMLVIFFSTANSFNINRLFPIFGYSINKTFFSGISNIFAFGGVAILYFLMPFLKSTKNFKKISIIAIIVSSVYLLLSVVSLLLVFSFISDTDLTLSIYSLTRKIEYSRFFQRTDALFILLWILLIFTYLSTILAFCLNIFKKISNISNSKAMTYCFALLLFAVGLICKNTVIIQYIKKDIYKYYEIILVFVVSIFILILGNIKYKKKNKLAKGGS